MSESYARTICEWSDKLPEPCRDAADAILVAAATAGAALADLAGLAAEIYARSLPDTSGDGPDERFEDRSLRVETTFDGAGVLNGDLTPECAAVVTAVLESLSSAGRSGGHADPGAALPRRAGRGDASAVILRHA